MAMSEEASEANWWKPQAPSRTGAQGRRQRPITVTLTRCRVSEGGFSQVRLARARLRPRGGAERRAPHNGRHITEPGLRASSNTVQGAGRHRGRSGQRGLRVGAGLRANPSGARAASCRRDKHASATLPPLLLSPILPAPPSPFSRPEVAQQPPFSRSFSNPQRLEQPLPDPGREQHLPGGRARRRSRERFGWVDTGHRPLLLPRIFRFSTWGPLYFASRRSRNSSSNSSEEDAVPVPKGSAPAARTSRGGMSVVGIDLGFLNCYIATIANEYSDRCTP
ncbi:hypothetical protein P7K49_006817 [Saguinus oedipus]|uniref:Uncharacterized protein n=1 Tax=Saguinus oedipus TaxID=9490 RepID=A0ABQ9W3H0_SAGOE|nr:hypothetical protein P7K49_006817 [Saguinus oedipus]